MGTNTKPIEMQEKRFGYFPQRFLMESLTYAVSSIERCWTKGNRRWFRVVTAQGMFDVAYDVRQNAWRARSYGRK